METLPLRAGDIVIVHYALGAVLQVENCRNIDISLAFRNSDIADNKFFDRVIHCGRYGYDLTAKFLMNSIKDLLNCSPIDKNFAKKASISLQSDLFKNFKEFIGDIKKNCAVDTNKSVGAVVMNCNPFTLGHLHLIEYAAAKVDFLYIFVVEEDKSIFPFKDRINLVRQGVSDIKNVYVTGSGKVMISTITFPTYFIKDNPATAALDASFDVEIFARYVAPELNISYRFVGEEPFDAVTRNYNRRMKEILPQFGINIVEIPRKKFYYSGNEIIISASKVREYLKVKNFDALKKLLPAVTYEYLLSKSKEMTF